MSNNYSIILLYNKTKNKFCIETKISNEYIDYIKSLKCSWYITKGGSNNSRNPGGYIIGRVNSKDVSLHSVIMNRVQEKPCDDFSVDHINRDKLDNRRENLRWSTRSQQSSNKDKMKRNKNTRPLPEGITQDM